MIGPFQDEYRFLSNFWPVAVTLDKLPYLTVEHAYQAAKTLDPSERVSIRFALSPGEAKRGGRNVTMRADWEQVKLSIMEDLLRQKFAHPQLKAKLLTTYPHELVEVNTWHDTFWGRCNGVGTNYLGHILMRIRGELRATLRGVNEEA